MLEQSRFLGASGWTRGLLPLRGGMGAGGCDAIPATEAGAGEKARDEIGEETAQQQDMEEDWEDDEKFFTDRSEGTLEDAMCEHEDRRTGDMYRALLSYPPPDAECSVLMQEVELHLTAHAFTNKI